MLHFSLTNIIYYLYEMYIVYFHPLITLIPNQHNICAGFYIVIYRHVGTFFCNFALDLDKSAKDLLIDMAKQTMSDQAKGNITVGIFD